MESEPVDGIEQEWIAFARRLKRLRKAARLSQAAVAREADMSKSFISLIEGRGTNPSLLSIFRLAEAIGVPAWRLLKDEDA